MIAESIFLPVAAVALLTFTALTFVPMMRFAAVARGRVGPNDFKMGESGRVPENVALPNRNYMNLLELPVLFYVVCIVFYVTGMIDGLVLNLAWAFAVFRALHSLIHMTYNNVIHRMLMFSIATFILLAMWIVLIGRVLEKAL